MSTALRLRSLIQRRRLEQDLRDELHSHIEFETRKNLARGMDHAEARRQAMIHFNGFERVTEECRDARGVNWITTVWRDSVYALRGFRRSPLFVATAVATIALGLGIDTALFSIFNAYYFAPVNVRDPYSLYAIGRTWSWDEYQKFLLQNPAFSEAFASRQPEVRLNDRRAFALLVTGDYFRILGASPAVGRFPDPSSSRNQPVLVLSFSTWQHRFAGDPNLIGKTVLVAGHPFEVAGVAQPGFRGLGARPVDFWAPIDSIPNVASPVSIVGRLKPEYRVTQANAAIRLWLQRLTAGTPDPTIPFRAELTSLANFKPWNPANTLTFAPILVAFSLVLLLGCANVVSMMLARAVSRQREFGVRLSLGASRAHLISQLLAESVMLALPSAAAGLLLSQAFIWLSIRVLFATLPPGIAEFTNRLPALSPDLRVFSYNLAVALAAAVVCGLVPAVQSTRTNLVQSFRPSRLRNALVVGQVTVCVLLLITAGILLRSVKQVHNFDASLSRRDTIEIALGENYRARVVDRLSSDPSVDTIAAASASPVDKKPWLSVSPRSGGTSLLVAANTVSPEYFTLFDLPIVIGRNFTDEEARSAAPVIILSQTAATRLWPNQNALGQTLSIANRPTAARVIGVSRDDLSRWITNGDEKTLAYFPGTARAEGNRIFLGVHGDAEAVRRKLDSNLATIDANAVDEIHRFQIREFVGEEAYSFRLAYWASAAIGLLALLLTVTGIYGVVAFIVSQRTREIGIRMALGATSTAVSGLILKQSMRLAFLGCLIGAVLALGTSTALASMIVIVNTFDLLTYFGGILFVLLACAAAGYLPTYRAARIDPVTTLRYD